MASVGSFSEMTQEDKSVSRMTNRVPLRSKSGDNLYEVI
jgi:hypothetical protein